MVLFPLWAVILMVIIAGSGVLSLLHALASTVRNDRLVQDVLTEAAELRAEYTAKLEQMAIDTGVDIGITSDVEIISD